MFLSRIIIKARLLLIQAKLASSFSMRASYLQANPVIPPCDSNVMDLQFEEADKESGTKKILYSASRYDRNHTSSTKLDGFFGVILPPVEMKDLLKRSFNVDLTPKELGALSGGFLDLENNFSVGDFITYFFQLSRKHREDRRKRDLGRFHLKP